MPGVPSQQAEATPGQAGALLAGVLAAAKAALPQGLDVLVWGAARLGDQATLRHLLANGGGPSWAPSKGDDEIWGGYSCLQVASSFGHEGAVQELLESGVDVDAERPDQDITLVAAAYNGPEGVIEQLLKAGAGINKATKGCTLLHMAALLGHKGVVEQLLKAGADVNKAATDNGTTPLHFAVQQGHEDVVEKLVKAGLASTRLRRQSLESLRLWRRQSMDTRAWLSSC